jgi:hypothetical protein
VVVINLLQQILFWSKVRHLRKLETGGAILLEELDIVFVFVADEVNMIPEDDTFFWSELLQLKN